MCLSAHLIASSPPFLSSIDFDFLAISGSMLKVLGNDGLNNIVQRRKERALSLKVDEFFRPANEMSRSLSSIAAIPQEKAVLSNIMGESYSDMSNESAEETFTKACSRKMPQK